MNNMTEVTVKLSSNTMVNITGGNSDAVCGLAEKLGKVILRDDRITYTIGQIEMNVYVNDMRVRIFGNSIDDVCALAQHVASERIITSVSNTAATAEYDKHSRFIGDMFHLLDQKIGHDSKRTDDTDTRRQYDAIKFIADNYTDLIIPRTYDAYRDNCVAGSSIYSNINSLENRIYTEAVDNLTHIYVNMLATICEKIKPLNDIIDASAIMRQHTISMPTKPYKFEDILELDRQVNIMSLDTILNKCRALSTLAIIHMNDKYEALRIIGNKHCVTSYDIDRSIEDLNVLYNNIYNNIKQAMSKLNRNIDTAVIYKTDMTYDTEHQQFSAWVNAYKKVGDKDGV